MKLYRLKVTLNSGRVGYLASMELNFYGLNFVVVTEADSSMLFACIDSINHIIELNNMLPTDAVQLEVVKC